MTLAEFLTAEKVRRWQAGTVDCTTFPADWAATWGRGDPMSEWRGAYSTEQGARNLIADAGGLDRLWQSGLEGIGLDRVLEPRAGDIGVILAMAYDHQPEQIGAIWTGRRWAFRIESGLAFASAIVVRCWGPR